MKLLLIDYHNSYSWVQLLTEAKNAACIVLIPMQQIAQCISQQIPQSIPPQKQLKIKIAQKLLTVEVADHDKCAAFIAEVAQLTTTIDNDLLWQMQDEMRVYTFNELATIYFGENADIKEQAALIFALSKAKGNWHDHRYGKFSKTTLLEKEEILTKIAAKDQEDRQFNADIAQIRQLQVPECLKNVDVYRLVNNKLAMKDPQEAAIIKLWQEACKSLQLSSIELAASLGLINNLADFFRQNFIYDNFPLGIHYQRSNLNWQIPFSDIPEADASLDIFSIDDEETTEIDDAFSVKELANNCQQVGVHIAAPALDLTIKQDVIEHFSTIYYPSGKISMLAPEVIERFSLNAGKTVPMLSLYFIIDSNFNILEYSSKLEVASIRSNLRQEQLLTWFNEAAIIGVSNSGDIVKPHVTKVNNSTNIAAELTTGINTVAAVYTDTLFYLYRFALNLEQMRGRASNSNLVSEYTVRVQNNKVRILKRNRNNPLDKLVSELMILANCTWGRMLTNAFIPALYRVKQLRFPVKTTQEVGGHIGLNVNYYTWATSPLRRAVDYINQWQLIALLSKTKKQLLKADDELMKSISSNFDKKHAKYIAFQDKMELYWSLQYLLQEKIDTISATVFFKNKVQLNLVPITIELTAEVLPAIGTEVQLSIYNINLANLSFAYELLS